MGKDSKKKLSVAWNHQRMPKMSQKKKISIGPLNDMPANNSLEEIRSLVREMPPHITGDAFYDPGGAGKAGEHAQGLPSHGKQRQKLWA